MKIIKKVWTKFFEDILKGKKNFELRLDNFECNENDTLILREYDPKTKQFTGREIEKKVNYVLKTKDVKFWKKEDIDKYGFQIISLK